MWTKRCKASALADRSRFFVSNLQAGVHGLRRIRKRVGGTRIASRSFRSRREGIQKAAETTPIRERFQLRSTPGLLPFVFGGRATRPSERPRADGPFLVTFKGSPFWLTSPGVGRRDDRAERGDDDRVDADARDHDDGGVDLLAGRVRVDVAEAHRRDRRDGPVEARDVQIEVPVAAAARVDDLGGSTGDLTSPSRGCSKARRARFETVPRHDRSLETQPKRVGNDREGGEPLF